MYEKHKCGRTRKTKNKNKTPYKIERSATRRNGVLSIMRDKRINQNQSIISNSDKSKARSKERPSDLLC